MGKRPPTGASITSRSQIDYLLFGFNFLIPKLKTHQDQGQGVLLKSQYTPTSTKSTQTTNNILINLSIIYDLL
ncbi:hypothetical protein SporoP32a_02545 [Sporosarcina ureae]|nr:hypothetical protein SporoP32a_02545 [Sporosarcina ureae]